MNEYLQSIIDRDPAAKSKLIIILTYPGVKALFFYKIANFFSLAKFHLVAKIISQLARFLTGIEIHPAARIGKNLFIDHGMGVVIGETSEIGDNVTIYHGVTLGGISPSVNSDQQRNIKRHPTIQDKVVIGSGAQILGPITIGRNSKIGSNAVVVKSVPEESTVVGVPGKLIERAEEKQESAVREEMASKMGFDAYGVSQDAPDPVAHAINCMIDHLHVVESEMKEICSSMEKMGMDVPKNSKLPDLPSCEIVSSPQKETDPKSSSSE